MVAHLPGEFSRGKGKGATAGRQEKGGDKSFCGPLQKVLAECISPFG